MKLLTHKMLHEKTKQEIDWLINAWEMTLNSPSNIWVHNFDACL
jgi:hypothetical protein